MSPETNEKYNLRIVIEKLQVQLWLRERFFKKDYNQCFLFYVSIYPCLGTTFTFIAMRKW